MADEFKTKILEELGLSKNEAIVYLSLLEMGTGTVGEIAEATKLHRTNVSDALKRLLEKGIVSYINKDDKKVFEAGDPKKLISYLREKEMKIKRILPELELCKRMAKSKNSATIYEGVQAFQKILDGFLIHNDPILVYGIPREAPTMMKTFIPHFHKKRIAQKIVMKHIYNHNAQDRIKFLNSMPYTEARYLHSQYDSKVSTNICGDEVVLCLWVEPVFVVQIKNQHIADAYKNFFELLYRDASAN